MPARFVTFCTFIRTFFPLHTLFLSGCVSVHITDPAGQVTVVRNVGYVSIQAPAGESVIGYVTGVGLVGAPLGWSFGYTTQRWALLGRDCRLVVWLPSSEIDPTFAQSLTTASNACLVQAKPNPSVATPKEVPQ